MVITQKPFEIPYNFDKKLIDFLNIYRPNINIHCIYLPPFELDYSDAAKKITIQFGHQDIPSTIQEYEDHIQYIRNFFPNKLMLLLQSNKYIMNKKKLSYYIKLGFTKFCVGSIKQAKIIKKIYPNAEIIGSITMKIEPEELNKRINLYKKYFDGFVLWFPYNRNIQKIDALPKDFNYILLVNCGCSIFCDGTHHWFEKTRKMESEFYKFCPREQCPENKVYEKIVFIKPTHLYLFENKVAYFKLQGRESTTQHIIQDIIMYTTNIDAYAVTKEHDIYQTYNKKMEKEF